MQEIIYCPGCRRRLSLPDDAIGRLAQCPACQRTFMAEMSLANPPGAAAAAAAATSRPASPVARPATAPVPAPKRFDDDYDRPRKRRRDDDDYGRRRRTASHRGGEILTFGLLALLPCFVTSIIFGLIAWIMANSDLAEMRTGRMDREGEGLTQAGRALGITGLFLWPIGTGCLFLAAR
ncbi:MAG TPA: hypothetical protein VHR72_12840 [Gemmataceae bacterium]|jgi:hypothetical protein|nr:hypothetical protein [Gemmataceae bacterium]